MLEKKLINQKSVSKNLASFVISSHYLFNLFNEFDIKSGFYYENMNQRKKSFYIYLERFCMIFVSKNILSLYRSKNLTG